MNRYRPSSKPPATTWARLFDRVRRENGWSQTTLFREVRSLFGLGEESRAAFPPYLVDKEPDEATAAKLAERFGWPHPEDEARPQAQPDLAVAISALAAELRAWREEDRERIADLEATVRRLIGEDLAGSGSEALAGRHVHVASTG